MSNEAIKTIAWSLLIVAALYPFEILFSANAENSLSRRLCNLAHMPLIVGFSYAMQPLVNSLATIVLGAGSFLPAVIKPHDSGTFVLICSVFFAVIWDFWQYWVHRLQHTNDYFWATHKFHHSETTLNATSHARTHAVSYVLYIVLYTPMLSLIGSMSPHWIVAFIMFRLWGYFIHANIRLRFGILTPVISGPQWHRIHHSARPEHRNKNFATFFPAIDIIFGTYYRPGWDEFPETGLGDGTDVNFLRDATIEPFLLWRSMVWRTRGAAKRPAREPSA